MECASHSLGSPLGWGLRLRCLSERDGGKDPKYCSGDKTGSRWKSEAQEKEDEVREQHWGSR